MNENAASLPQTDVTPPREPRTPEPDAASSKPDTVNDKHRTDDFTPSSTTEPTATLPVVPGFEIEKELARGGMGVVYQARDMAMNRTVAVKLLQDKYPTDSPGAARFLEEAQITGQLQHPGIPPIYQVGTLADGRPFLAMKLIKGETLEAKITRGDKINYLALIEAIAQAVGYAHAHGVIHRDLKPHNIMVGAFGEVQVMDWGLAKLLSEPPGLSRRSDADVPLATTMYNPRSATGGSDTQAGSVLGTPAYMAPEQAAGEIAKIDQRCDVFGLGAVLCHLLTGRPPYQGTDHHAILVDASRGKTEEAFARLDACGAEPEVIALSKRCLAFEPNDRPADGNAVAMEVAALRAAAEERAKQAEIDRAKAEVFAAEQRKRRRVWIGLAASLLVGLAILAGGLYFVNEEKNRTAERAEGERLAKVAAEENLAYAKKGNELLGSVFAKLDPKANYANVGELSQALKANLHKAVKELEGSAIGDPLTVAEMQNRLGASLLGLGETEQAIILFEKARATRQGKLGADHPETLMSMNSLAEGYRAAGKLDRALQLYEETLKLRKSKLGADHPNTLTSMANLAEGYRAAGKLDRALPLYEETLKLMKAKLGAEHNHTLTSMNNQAAGYADAGKLELALPLYEETLKLMKAKLGADHPHTLTSMGNLAQCYWTAGKLELALPLYEETLKLTKGKLGADHPQTLRSMNNLAEGYQAAGKLELALPLYEETLKLRKAKLGADHPDTLRSMGNLAQCYRTAGKLELALPLLEATLKLRRSKLGPDHRDTLTSMNNLAIGYEAAGKLELALSLFEETLKLKKAKLGADHPDTLTTMGNLANGYHVAGKLDLALPLYEETLKLRRSKLGPDHPNTHTSMSNLAVAYQDVGKLDLALLLYADTLKLTKAKLGPDHPDTLTSMSNLAAGYHEAGQLDKALPLWEDTLRRMKSKLGPDHPNTLTNMNNLAAGYRSAGKLDLALPLYEETLKLRKSKLGPDHRDTLQSMNNLAIGYEAAGKLDRALPLYEETLKLRKSKLGLDHPETLTSMNNLATGFHVARKLDRALPLYEETLKLRKAKLGPDHPATLTSMHNLAKGYWEIGQLDRALPLYEAATLGIEKRRFQHENASIFVNSLRDSYEQLKRFDQAEAWRRKWLAVVKQRAGADSIPYASELVGLGSNLLQQKKWTEAETVLRECLAIRDKQMPDSWLKFNTQSMLGEALLGQKKHSEAEPLLLQGYEGMKQRANRRDQPGGSPTPQRLTQALQRLVQLYEATGKKEEAAKWKKELAESNIAPKQPTK